MSVKDSSCHDINHTDCAQLGKGTGYSCRKCGKIFKYLILFENHQKEKCQKKINPALANLQRHSKSKDQCLSDESYECSDPGENSGSLRNVYVDTGSNIVEGPSKSSECTETSNSPCRSVTLRNRKRVHTGEKLFKCVECDKSFNRQRHLDDHIRTHTGEKPYQCVECDKSFSQERYLDDHMKTHTGEKPYECLDCGKSFSDKTTFKRHKRVHTGEKPYTCSKCGKTYSRSDNLNSHMRKFCQ